MKKIIKSNKMMTKKKYRNNLSTFIMISACKALCFSCVVATFVVILGAHLFYHGPITKTFLVFCCLLICTICMILGIILISLEAKKISKPILKVTEAVNEVSKENFEIRLPREESKRGAYQYRDEIDELSENVNQMAEKLGNLDYMRRDFISNVSHEVKTPVAAITGFTEMILEGDLEPDKQKEYLQMVNDQANSLSDLCESMLRLSRLDYEDKVELSDTVRLDEQIRKCIIVLSEKWAEKEIEFELNLPYVEIHTNEKLLNQVWMNLIDNAMKYSSPGSSISVNLFRQMHLIEITIKDHGIGIAKEKQSRIFERFYQCEESHKKKGSGLGLSIVKKILDLLNGSIQYESELGKGTIVTVNLRDEEIDKQKYI